MARWGDTDLARHFLEVGCWRSSSVCVTAAKMYDAGRVVPENTALATQFWQHACKAKQAMACTAVTKH